MKGHKKGQAVMEYLITYGLALFVILIVLAILVAVVLPTLQAPETCQFNQPGFGCSERQHVLVSDSNDDVKLLFQLDNQQGESVVITGVYCTTAPSGDIRRSDVESRGEVLEESMPAGSSLSFGNEDSDVNVDVFCYDDAGSSYKLAAGSNFRGTLAITYKFAQEVPGAPDRLALATVTGNTQAE